jgi:hypothetical protein
MSLRLPRICSKRLAVTLLTKTASALLVVYGIWAACHFPESSTQVAAICSTCVTMIVAGAHGYTKGETARPSE